MKKILLSVCMLCMAAAAMAQADALKSKIVEDGGQGPYKAIMTEVPGLQAHTVFAPQDLSKFGTLSGVTVLAPILLGSTISSSTRLPAMASSWWLLVISLWRKSPIRDRCPPPSSR